MLQQILTIAEARQVEAVLIAGDIYDRAVPPAAAIELLGDTLQALHTLNIPVIIIPGNHDSAVRLSFAATMLADTQLYILGDLSRIAEPVILQDAAGPVAFYGIPYADPVSVNAAFDAGISSHDEAMALLTDKILTASHSDTRTVVLSHCFVSGSQTSDSERPLSIGGAESVSYQHFLPFHYTALGHLHGRQYCGEPHIRYSGSILKYSFSEVRQIKSVTLLDLKATGSLDIEEIPLVAQRDVRIISGPLENLLMQADNDPAREDYLLARVEDKHAILDLMNKMRSHYPNLLQIERPGLDSRQLPRTPEGKNQLRRGEMALFGDFYQQVTGEELTPTQQDYLADILDHLHKET